MSDPVFDRRQDNFRLLLPRFWAIEGLVPFNPFAEELLLLTMVTTSKAPVELFFAIPFSASTMLRSVFLVDVIVDPCFGFALSALEAPTWRNKSGALLGFLFILFVPLREGARSIFGRLLLRPEPAPKLGLERCFRKVRLLALFPLAGSSWAKVWSKPLGLEEDRR